MSVPIQPVYPALSDTLIHFTSRAQQRLDLLAGIASMGPDQRLNGIIRDERILGFPTYWSRRQVVCLSESREEDINYLLAHRRWQPWGLFFSAADVDRAGGGPVWYARTERWRQVQNLDGEVAEDLGQWIVRWDTTEQGFSDWRHEREWRLPGPFLDLRAVPPVGVLVGDPTWEFAPEPELIPGCLGDYPQHWVPGHTPRWVSGLPRWWWDGESRRLWQVE